MYVFLINWLRYFVLAFDCLVLLLLGLRLDVLEFTNLSWLLIFLRVFTHLLVLVCFHCSLFISPTLFYGSVLFRLLTSYDSISFRHSYLWITCYRLSFYSIHRHLIHVAILGIYLFLQVYFT